MSHGSLARRRLRRQADPEIQARARAWALDAARDAAHARFVHLMQRAQESADNDDLEAAVSQRAEAARVRRDFRHAWGQEL